MSELNAEQIKKYLKSVFDLESALYQHKQLVEKYIEYRQKNQPSKPVKNFNLDIKTEPVSFKKVSNRVNFLYVLASLAFIVGIIILNFLTSFSILQIILGLVLILVSVVCYYYAYKDNKLQKSKIEKEYEFFNKTIMDKRDLAIKEADEEYSNKMKVYNDCLREYNQETTEQLKKFDDVQISLHSSLVKLYSQNILYAKYRNFVAVATIYEYFDSGRCDELEGPNGAYNLYEGELRASIIISSLSQIISDLGQIKYGQYALYEQIQRSNENVAHLLNNILDAQLLTAYYAEAAAIAASADRVTYGVVF